MQGAVTDVDLDVGEVLTDAASRRHDHADGAVQMRMQESCAARSVLFLQIWKLPELIDEVE